MSITRQITHLNGLGDVEKLFASDIGLIEWNIESHRFSFPLFYGVQSLGEIVPYCITKAD